MSAERVEALVTSLVPAARNVMRLALTVPERAAESIQPGQFAHLLVPGDSGLHQLRRPLSIAGRAGSEVLFFFRVQGDGTRQMAKMHAGDRIDVLLPLGHGFTPPAPGEDIWLVGGGTGVAALLPLAAGRRFFMGFREERDAFGREEAKLADLKVAFEEQGDLVTDVLARSLRVSRPDRILACGPHAMYRSLRRLTAGIPVEVSLEQRMGCGTGGCAGCVVKVDGRYVKSCTEGPVFRLENVDEY